MSVTFKELGALGRLGNQLWQIAAVAGYAHKYKMDYMVPQWKYAKFFNGLFNQMQNLPNFETYQEKHFHYQTIPYYKDVNLSGYFQSLRYFEHCQNEIKSMLAFKSEIVQEIRAFIDYSRQGRCPVFVHVRRGDYVQTMSHYYHELTLDWYKNAINKFDHDTHHFFVLSDDIQWCKAHMTFFAKNITFSKFDEVHDLCLMSECHHGIMANSSFSWFGQYLIANPNKRIIAPTKDNWFKPVAGHNVDDLYYGNNWELI